ncbi:MAG: hypothetical protein ACLP50_08500 [Solirubrobacteraceae bacterium]
MWLPGRLSASSWSVWRLALGDVLDHRLGVGEAYLTLEGWPLDSPASSSEAWSTIMYALADVATAVGRCSERARTIAPAEEGSRSRRRRGSRGSRCGPEPPVAERAASRLLEAQRSATRHGA